MANDLNKLNDVLFDTLKDLREGKIDEKRSQAVVNIGNSIVNNAKIQLAAFKMTKGTDDVKMRLINDGYKVYKGNWDAIMTDCLIIEW